MAAVDKAVSYLAEDGIVGMADFFTSSKYDLPNRQHTFLQRWFWRTVFDCDGIDVGPERRQYVEHKMAPGEVPALPSLRTEVLISEEMQSVALVVWDNFLWPCTVLYLNKLGISTPTIVLWKNL